jgi:hypothetical protein
VSFKKLNKMKKMKKMNEGKWNITKVKTIIMNGGVIRQTRSEIREYESDFGGKSGMSLGVGCLATGDG